MSALFEDARRRLPEIAMTLIGLLLSTKVQTPRTVGLFQLARAAAGFLSIVTLRWMAPLRRAPALRLAGPKPSVFGLQERMPGFPTVRRMLE